MSSTLTFVFDNRDAGPQSARYSVFGQRYSYSGTLAASGVGSPSGHEAQQTVAVSGSSAYTIVLHQNRPGAPSFTTSAPEGAVIKIVFAGATPH